MITWVPDVLATSPGATGPLTGIRIGVKDNIAIGGVRSTCGSRFFDDRVPETDSAVVRLLKEAGAAVDCTLNMAEFAVGVTSQNSASGGCRNPWDPARVPGGSSGGSGAAVAAGIVDVALGTDTGGSIRLPASCCGVTGLRPSSGLIDQTGVDPVCTLFDSAGPMARSVVEVRRVFRVMARITDDDDLQTPHRLRVAVPRPFITDDVDASVRAAVDRLVDGIRAMGHHVTGTPVPHSDSAQDVVYTLVYSDLARRNADRLRDRPELFEPATAERIRLGSDISDRDRDEALRRRDVFRAGMDTYLDDVDVIVTPTMPVDVPLIDGDASVVAQSRRLGQLTYPWSLHDGPTLRIPVGVHAKSGMPIGAQLTAAHGAEETVFALARQIEERTSWHRRRPAVRVTSVA